jgi:hypothetical protein
MIKIIFIILTVLVVMLSGCSGSNKAVIYENEKLKNKISQFEKDLNDKNIEINELKKIESEFLTINYIENTSSKRFVEKQCDLLGLPINNSIRLNLIKDNTIVTILDTANVNNDIWFYVLMPVNDSPSNYKGWIKESDTFLYTKDKQKSVQSEVRVKKGDAVYNVEDVSYIKSNIPSKAGDEVHGRILERKDGYVKLECPGGFIVWVKEASIIYPEIN